MTPRIRPVNAADPDTLAAAFLFTGWDGKTAGRLRTCVHEQSQGTCDTLNAEGLGRAGYVKIMWTSDDPAFHAEGIPEIADLNVVPKC
ncbi:MAG: hypothetical protein AAGB15_15755 [Pseudomonadota bacterium]